jgi:hypothetical protein
LRHRAGYDLAISSAMSLGGGSIEEFIEERARLVRSLADKADPFIKVRLIELAERYERKLRIRSRTVRTNQTLVGLSPEARGSKQGRSDQGSIPIGAQAIEAAPGLVPSVWNRRRASLLRDKIDQRFGLRYLFRVDHSSLVSLDRYRRGIFSLVGNKAYLSFHHENLSRECGANCRH